MGTHGHGPPFAPASTCRIRTQKLTWANTEGTAHPQDMAYCIRCTALVHLLLLLLLLHLPSHTKISRGVHGDALHLSTSCIHLQT